MSVAPYFDFFLAWGPDGVPGPLETPPEVVLRWFWHHFVLFFSPFLPKKSIELKGDSVHARTLLKKIAIVTPPTRRLRGSVREARGKRKTNKNDRLGIHTSKVNGTVAEHGCAGWIIYLM